MGKTSRIVTLSFLGTLCFLVALTALAACARESRDAHGGERLELSDEPAAPAPEAPLVVFLGDSLTAGLGLPEEAAFPALVGQRLAAAGMPARVVNAGVSGDTSAGGRARLPWLLSQRPAVLVLGLGANDGLRGHPLASIESNLRAIILEARREGAEVLLLGMRIPPSHGLDYAEGFAAIYPRLAEELSVATVPFLLDGVAADPTRNLPDGIHPNAEGHLRIAENVLPHLTRLLSGSAWPALSTGGPAAGRRGSLPSVPSSATR